MIVPKPCKKCGSDRFFKLWDADHNPRGKRTYGNKKYQCQKCGEIQWV